MTNTQKPTITVLGWNVMPGDTLAHTSAPIASRRMENGVVYFTIPFVRGEIARSMNEKVVIHPKSL